jgi:hypothetical protein
LPEELKAEVIDFIEFLLTKKKRTQGHIKPAFGCAKGQIIMSSDFDEPIEDFKDYM